MKSLLLLIFSSVYHLGFANECVGVLTKEMVVQIANEVIFYDAEFPKLELLSANCSKDNEQPIGVWFVAFTCKEYDGAWMPGCEQSVTVTDEINPLVNGVRYVPK